MEQVPGIRISAVVNSGLKKAWNSFTESRHITNWNFANDEWHCPKAENDIEQGGKFLYRMEAKDGSAGFDFAGTYSFIVPFEKIEYLLEDGRRVEVFSRNRMRITLR